MLGLSLFTASHIVISLVGIVAGFVAIQGMIAGRRTPRWTILFLAFTLATTLTGFLFPHHGVTPAITLGLISLAVAVPTLAARYAFDMRGAWRTVWVVGAVLLQYFNCFVLVAQLFAKVPALHALAPTGNEPPFAAAQGVLLLALLAACVLAVRRFRP
ncbi:MAG: hypothetical protein ACREHE_17675 [Rhizomicrobium sp.]